MYATQIFFITLLRFVWNGFIYLYRDILNKLYCDPINNITRDRKKSSIELKVYFSFKFSCHFWDNVAICLQIHCRIHSCFWSKNCQLFWNVQHLSNSNSNSFSIHLFKIFHATLSAFLDLFIYLFSCDNSIFYLFYSSSVIFFLLSVLRWHWTYGHMQIVLTST